MSYELLFKEFKTTKPFEPLFSLDSQTRYAVLSLVISTLLISLALTTAYSKRSFPMRLIFYTLLSSVGSLFCGISIIFLANSLGVYV